MPEYIFRRLLLAVPTFIGAVTLVFLVMRVLPGDAASVILAGQETAIEASDEQLAALREQLGLNRPLIVQYFQWLWDAVRFDFGDSLWYPTPVLDEFKLRYPFSLSILVIALATSLIIAIPAGIISAVKQDTWIDYGLRIFTLAGLSVPSFFVAILTILFLLRFFGWLPPLAHAPIWEAPWPNFQRLLFPSLIIGYRLSAIGTRMTRSSVLEVMREDYVRTARAKGLREQVVIWRHALRNAILPVLTLVGIEIIVLFSGLVIMETVFTIPGMGSLLVDALFHRDYITVQGVVFVFALFVLLMNLLVDMSYAFFDPRIRLQ
ncbi:MAG: ABC transporter permease [Chloroflexi bacterium]|nr:ABC transporter permease [Chloroflexota bacterium]